MTSVWVALPSLDIGRCWSVSPEVVYLARFEFHCFMPVGAPWKEVHEAGLQHQCSTGQLFSDGVHGCIEADEAQPCFAAGGST